MLKFKQEGWTDEEAQKTLELFFSTAITTQIFQYCIYGNYLDNVMSQIITNIQLGQQQPTTIDVRNKIDEITQKLTIQYERNIPKQENLSGLFA